MARIKVIFDTSNFNHDSQQKFNHLTDYPRLYSSVLSALQQDTDQTFIIGNSRLFEWIQNINNYEPENSIHVEKISLREKVEDSWETLIPAYILESDLQQLISSIPSPKNTGDFEDIVLFEYLGLNFSSFSLKELLKWLPNFPFEVFEDLESNSLFHKIWNSKKEYLLLHNRDTKKIIDIFFKNPKELILQITLYKVLKNYSNSLKNRFIEDEINVELQLYDINLQNNLVESQILGREFFSSLSVELNTILKSCENEADFIDIINMTSGLLEEELNILLEFLSNKEGLSKETCIERIKEKYSYIIKRNMLFNKKLNDLVAPSSPSDPNCYNEIYDWIHWAVSEYLPYKFWLEDKQLSSEIVNKYSNDFSTFIYSNFLNLKFAYDNVLWKLIPNIKQDIDNQIYTIIIIIDNFNYKFVNYLSEEFYKNGFFVNLSESYLSMIPTETKISKTALLSSNYKFESQERNYRNLFESTWKNSFDSKKLHYLAKISELDEVSEDKNLVVINFGMIDEYLHQDERKMAITKTNLIRTELSSLVKRVSEFIKNKSNVDIYVTSDHGSTFLDSETSDIVDQKLLQNKFLECSERVLTVSDNQLKHSRDWFENYGFILEKSKYDLDQNYILAKKNYSFKNISSSAYFHGSLTPEELIVPLIQYKKRSVNIIEPVLLLEGNTFRYNVKTNLEFLIENPNDVTLEKVSIQLTSSFISSEQNLYSIERIPPISRATLNFKGARFIRKSDSKPTHIDVSLKYQINGMEYANDVSIPIIIKSIQQNNFDFDF